jgi:hypothetical protein
MPANSTRDLAKMKQKIAQLLAQAESTPYPEEAETFTAAAEKMMLRLGIARAELESIGETKAEKVTQIRRTYTGIHAIGFISDGHAIATGWGHISTLQASVNRGRTRQLYLVGVESDLAELTQLLDSLDVQVLTALAAWRKTNADRRRYQTAMQKELADRSFISGFGSRVGRRLKEARTVQEAEVKGTGTELVLVGKDQRVKDFMEETYPNLRSSHSRQGSSWEGHAAGFAAGGNANLGQKGLGNRAGQIGA